MNTSSSLRFLQHWAKLMDSQFRIPGTQIRFGLDPLIGLIPGAGDFSTFAVSAIMVMVLAQNGASGFLLARMILNIVIDALIGSVPFIGDIFDFAFKANQRNVRLMMEHYQEGRHKGGAWKVVVPVLVLLLAFVILLVWISYRILIWVWHLFQ